MSLTDDDKQWITRQCQAVDTKLEALDTKLEALETRLLRAFHDWDSPAEIRARTHAAVLRALDIDVGLPGNRPSKIDPPH